MNNLDLKNEIEALEEAKRQALLKVKEIDEIIAKAKMQLDEQTSEPIKKVIEEPQINVESQQPIEAKKEIVAETIEKKTIVEAKQQNESEKEETEAVPTNPKEKKAYLEKRKQEQHKQDREKEKMQIEAFNKSAINRSKGRIKAEPGNAKTRYTNNEVFLFVVDDNELQLKIMQEQFKNSRSFKNTKGFLSGEELLNYLTTRKFPKNAILIVIMDYFLEKANEVDTQNGIEVMRKIKNYDPDIEVIMLSGNTDVDIAASAAHFGAVTFIQKGNDAMQKIFNNIVWTIKEKDKIRQKVQNGAFRRSAFVIFLLAVVAIIIWNVVIPALKR